MKRINPATETVVSIPQAAKHYGVSAPTMWRWILGYEGHPPKVPSFKIGRTRRTTLEAVARAVQINEVA